ncbi:MAG: hypothetical protein JO122_03185 [Acetobacteraceae bacterium]|nr:hypothetical protein [Acetobacteraceae bacterium]
MSDKREPTLTEVMAALQGLQAVTAEQITQLRDRMDRLEAVVTRQDEKLTELRVVAMERMDRLQNTISEMRDDQSVLLGLPDTNQKLTERSMTEARFSSDQYTSLAHTVTLVEMQVRKLRADGDELRAQVTH